MIEEQRFAEIITEMSQEREAGPVTFELSDEDFAAISEEQAAELSTTYGGGVLVRLPEKERTFFTWLLEHDPEIWNDLWGSADDPLVYYVGASHISSFLPKKRGFPICDLTESANYHFVGDDITDENGKVHLETALDVVAQQRTLAMEQAFVIEVWRAPIDQWRFAWLYKLPLEEVKKMVHWLIGQEILRVPTQRDPNAPMIEVEEKSADPLGRSDA